MTPILNNPRHKIACLALYKAFLTHCRKLPIPQLQKDATKYVTKQFHKYKSLNTVTNVQRIFINAYEQEITMRKAAAGDITCLAAVQAHFAALSALNKPNPPRPKPPLKPILTLRTKKRLKSFKKMERRVAMGLPAIKPRKGPAVWQPERHKIPILSSGNSFPLLRIRGQATPINVAMTIKNLIKLRQRRQDRLELLQEHLAYASAEDMWDAEVEEYLEDTVKERWEKTWTEEMEDAIKYLTNAMRRREEKNKILAEKFWDIEMRAKEQYAEIIRKRRNKRRKRSRRNRNRKAAAGLNKSCP